MYCEQAETILPLLALGELEGDRRAAVEAHLAECPACRAKLADMQATLQLLEEAVARLPEPRLSQERRKALAEIAAAAGKTDLAKAGLVLRKVDQPATAAAESNLAKDNTNLRKVEQGAADADDLARREQKIAPRKVVGAVVDAGNLAKVGTNLRKVSKALGKFFVYPTDTPESDRPPISRLMPAVRDAARLATGSLLPQVSGLVKVAAAVLVCGILAALFLPALSAPREKARRATPSALRGDMDGSYQKSIFNYTTEAQDDSPSGYGSAAPVPAAPPAAVAGEDRWKNNYRAGRIAGDITAKSGEEGKAYQSYDELRHFRDSGVEKGAASFESSPSLAILYPDFADKVTIFRAPSTEDRRMAVVTGDGKSRITRFVDELPQAESNRLLENEKLSASMHGGAAGQPFAPGEDGRKSSETASALGTARSTNGHEGGQNVLFADGDVKWKDENKWESDGLSDAADRFSEGELFTFSVVDADSARSKYEVAANAPQSDAETLRGTLRFSDWNDRSFALGDSSYGYDSRGYPGSGARVAGTVGSDKKEMSEYLAKLRTEDVAKEPASRMESAPNGLGDLLRMRVRGDGGATVGFTADNRGPVGLSGPAGKPGRTGSNGRQGPTGLAGPASGAGGADGAVAVSKPEVTITNGVAQSVEYHTYDATIAAPDGTMDGGVSYAREAEKAKKIMEDVAKVSGERAEAEEQAKRREKLVFPEAAYQYPAKEIWDEMQAREGKGTPGRLTTDAATKAAESTVVAMGTAADVSKQWGVETDGYLWDGPNARQVQISDEQKRAAALETALEPSSALHPDDKRAEDSALHQEDEPVTQRPAFKAGPVNPWVMAAKDALSTFGIDVDTASYAIGRNYIFNAKKLPPQASVRMEEYVNAFDYNYPTQSSGVFSIHAEAAPSPFGGPGLTLLKVGVRARVMGRDARKPANLVFVVDASGSMDKPDRMPLVKFALRSLVEKLDPQDRVSLVTFGTHSLIALESVPASERQKIIETVNGLRCNGSTNMLEGLELGYQLAARAFTPGAVNRVILCSDGIANIGATDAEAMLARVEAFRRQGVALTAAGFGLGAYDDVLLERMADKGDGNYFFLDNEAEARRVFVEEMAATMQTVAADAKIQVSFDPARVRRYRLIGFENRDIADVDFRNDTVDAGEVGSGQSSTALYELELLTPKDKLPPLGDIGTVFVRYRNLETGKVEEIEQKLQSGIVRQRTVQDSPRFFLAACAAQFAEILRGSEHARNGSIAQVRPIIQAVAAELPLDSRVQELAALVERADGLPAAE